jgi:hypothetical protein
MVGPAKTMYMDEISTGLDSSTTYLIVRCIRNYVHLLEVGAKWSMRSVTAGWTNPSTPNFVIGAEGDCHFWGPCMRGADIL